MHSWVPLTEICISRLLQTLDYARHRIVPGFQATAEKKFHCIFWLTNNCFEHADKKVVFHIFHPQQLKTKLVAHYRSRLKSKLLKLFDANCLIYWLHWRTLIGSDETLAVFILFSSIRPTGRMMVIGYEIIGSLPSHPSLRRFFCVPHNEGDLGIDFLAVPVLMCKRHR